MRTKMRTSAVGLGMASALLLVGCGGGEQERPPAYEPTNPVSASTPSGVETLPGAAGSGEPNGSPEPSAGDPNGSPESSAGDPNGSSAASTSTSPTGEATEAGVPNGTPEPGPGDVAGNGVVVPSPSPAVEGDGKEFPGFVDQSTVDRSSAQEVAIEAMRGLSVWDTTQDTKPGDAGARVESLVSPEALERGAGGPGKWTPLWWRQATAAGAWSSAETELAPLGTDAQPPEGVEMVTVEVTWTWHADEGSVVPEGDSYSCTVAVEEVDGQQTVTAFDCQGSAAEAEDMSS